RACETESGDELLGSRSGVRQAGALRVTVRWRCVFPAPRVAPREKQRESYVRRSWSLGLADGGSIPPASTNRRFPASSGREPMPGTERAGASPGAPRGAARASGIALPVQRDEPPIQVRQPVATHEP